MTGSTDGDGLPMLGGADQPPPAPGRRRAATKPRRGRRLLRLGLVLAVVAALVGTGIWGVGKLDSWFNGPEDYPGQGTGEAIVEIPQGADGQVIADILAKEDVVASPEAFYQLALDDQRISQVHPGFYRLRSQMSAEWAIRELTDDKNRVESQVTVPEGARVKKMPEIISESVDIPAQQVKSELENPANLGLPAEADGQPEGFLYPATYTVDPGTSARELLRQMVARTEQVLRQNNVAARAKQRGFTTREILTIASILEWEVADEDFGKASRVIYNRLDVSEALRMDSTVHFISGREGDIFTTDRERASKSRYNTYRYEGLPPGPIGSPGEAAIEAALEPERGNWMYFVADPDTGKTTFSESYAQQQAACRKAGFSC